MADHLQIYQDATSLPALFFNSCKDRRRKPFLWTKRKGAYESESWGKIHDDIVNLAKALVDMGVSAGDRVVLVSENRSEWLVSDVGIMTAGGVTVPSYTTNTTPEHLHVITNSGAVGIIVSTRELAEKVLPAAMEAPDVKFMICMEPMMIQQKKTLDIQAMVIGDKQPHATALIVPDIEFLAEWKTANAKDGTLETLAQDPDLIALISAAVDRVNANLSNIERVRKFMLATHE